MLTYCEVIDTRAGRQQLWRHNDRLFLCGCYRCFLSIFCDPRVSTRGIASIYNIFGWHWHGSAPVNSDINRIIAELTQSYKDHWYKYVHIDGVANFLYSNQLTKKILPEPYLITMKCKKNEGSLAQLRLGAHSLEIERGRYARPPIPAEERFCTYCSKKGNNHIGDEKHFLLECPLYIKEREDMVSNVSTSCPNFTSMITENRFLYLLTCEGNAALHVARYIHVLTAFNKKKIP